MMNNNKRSQINWGIILIGIGLLFLLNTIGVVRYFNWSLLLHLWPVIIIIIGVNIILKSTPLWWLTPVIFVLGILGLFLVSNGDGYYTYNYNFDFRPPLVNRESNTYRSETEISPDIEMMEVELNFSAGRLILDSVREEKNLYETSLSYKNSSPYFDYSYEKDKNIGYLSIKQPEESNNWFNFSARNDWQLFLTRNIPLIIKVNAGAGEFNFNLEELNAQELTINSGAGDLEIDLGEDTQYLRLNSAAANVDLNIPDNRALSIRSEGLISNNNFTDKGLIKTKNNIYQTLNYQNSTNKLIIEINSPASNIDLDFYRVD